MTLDLQLPELKSPRLADVCVLALPGQQGQHSRQLRERLVELELEIERFRKENTALAKLRQENEQSQESLR